MSDLVRSAVAPDQAAEESSSRGGWWQALLVVLLCGNALLFCAGMGRALHGQTDFRAFYAAGRAVMSGHGAQLYSLSAQQATQAATAGSTGRTLPFLYPAFMALVFVPFAWMPFRLAWAAFAIGNTGVLFFLVRRIVAPAWPPAPSRRVAGLAPWCVLPLTIVLLQGQISLLLLGIYSFAADREERNQPFTAGLILSLALAKYQTALLVLLLLLAWRRWRTLLGAATGAAVLGAVSLALTGVRGAQEFFRSSAMLAHLAATDPVRARSVYGMFPRDMPNLRGVFYACFPAHPTLCLALTAAASLLILAATAATARTAARPRQLAFALPAALLVSYHLQVYDLTLLLLPLAQLLLHGEHGKAASTARRFALLAFAALTPPVAGVCVTRGQGWMLIAVTLLVWQSSYIASRAAVLYRPGGPPEPEPRLMPSLTVPELATISATTLRGREA